MSKKNRSTIYNALPIVAAAYGEQFGVNVQIGSDMAHTDGKSIVVPNVPADYPNMDVVWGYLTHEAAHVRLTDFDVIPSSELHHHLTNTLEDCRIERWMIQEYPGTIHTLDAVANYMAEKGQYGDPTSENLPSEVLGAYCLYWLQGYGVGQTVLQAKADRAGKVLSAMLPAGVVLKLEVMLRHAVNLQSTQEASDLAASIISMLEEEQQKAQNSPSASLQDSQQGQQADQQQCGSGDDASSEGHVQNQSSDSDSDQGQDGQQNTQSGSNAGDESSDTRADGQSGQQANGRASAQQGAGSAGQDKADALRQILRANQDQLPEAAQSALKRELGDAAHAQGDMSYQTIRQAETLPASASGNDLLSSVKANSNRIRQQLFGLVQAQNRSARQTVRTGKRFDHNRIARVVSGDSRVFVRSKQKRNPNTAVHLLVDSSSSMNRSCGVGQTMMDVARDGALALALSLEAITGVNPAVTFFGGSGNRKLFSAVKHGQRVLANAGRFIKAASGTTPMAEALWYAAYEMTKVHEERKLIIIVTDGEPSSPAAVQAITNLCERSDVEIIGIGIGTKAVTKFFQRCIVINDATELRGTLFGLMEQSLKVAA
ncbi:VWA domain-containing protein [Alcaligenes faecalis]|uniref:cobaltochelatase CobT-related protein n=1 Tax=Alcaligenes faecalis TaxID=511 RepID=UPI000F67C85D|nr:VWA domain-containing protein [Alcaligenes faecalis]RSE57661.1 VWA domain-containing protein [Alcaligenes faecalis]